MRLERFSAFVDQGVTDAFFRSQKKFGYFAEADQTRPGPKRYPGASLDLLQRPQYACESTCLFLRLPPWRDVDTELDAAVLLNNGLSLSSSQQARLTFFLSVEVACRPIEVLVPSIEHFF